MGFRADYHRTALSRALARLTAFNEPSPISRARPFSPNLIPKLSDGSGGHDGRMICVIDHSVVGEMFRYVFV